MKSRADPTLANTARIVDADVESARRWRLKAPLALLLALGLPSVGWAGLPLVARAARLWPGPDSSRITLEFDAEPRFTQFTLKNPERLVLDLEGLEPDGVLASLASKVVAEDTYIAGIRVGRNRPGVARVVVELKRSIQARVFTLKPMGDYAHRLVVDLLDATAVAANSEGSGPGSTLQERTAQAQTSGNEPEVKRLITIAIDPGHGGEDPGAIGARGTHEKNVTLAIARRMKAQIDAHDNFRAVLIRDGDYFIPLHERVNKARRVQADLFVSVHADAFYKQSARGSSVFVLSEKGGTSVAARWLAKKENDADLIGGVSIDVKQVYVREALMDMSTDAQIRDSLKLARGVLEEIGGVNDLHKPFVEQAGFAVLKAPDIPSILIETAFISNPEEERKLNDEGHQDRMAAAIVAGLKRYLAGNPPLARYKQVAKL